MVHTTMPLRSCKVTYSQPPWDHGSDIQAASGLRPGRTYLYPPTQIFFETMYNAISWFHDISRMISYVINVCGILAICQHWHLLKIFTGVCSSLLTKVLRNTFLSPLFFVKKRFIGSICMYACMRDDDIRQNKATDPTRDGCESPCRCWELNSRRAASARNHRAISLALSVFDFKHWRSDLENWFSVLTLESGSELSSL